MDTKTGRMVLIHRNHEEKINGVKQAAPRRVRKLGRNEKCYCGSGKKYKKCHGGANRVFPPYPDRED